MSTCLYTWHDVVNHQCIRTAGHEDDNDPHECRCGTFDYGRSEPGK